MTNISGFKVDKQPEQGPIKVKPPVTPNGGPPSGPPDNPPKKS